MKIGIMGLGNIAQKAYLPIMGAMQEIDWVLHTRNEETLNQLTEKYNFKESTTDFETFINSGIKACFIHTPTSTHYEIIKTLLEHKIHVYVDKPISENIEETKELIAYANKHSLILMTGFNRRFAPLSQKLKETQNKNMIIVRKNRSNARQNTKFAAHDMMIHVVDTALFLLDDEIIDTQAKLIQENGIFKRAVLNIETPSTSLIAYMNMQSGANPETFEVMSDDKHIIVNDLNTMITKTPKGEMIETFPDWTPTLERRGFETIIKHFIDLIQNNKTYDSTSDLQSHEMVDYILKNASTE